MCAVLDASGRIEYNKRVSVTQTPGLPACHPTKSELDAVDRLLQSLIREGRSARTRLLEKELAEYGECLL